MNDSFTNRIQTFVTKKPFIIGFIILVILFLFVTIYQASSHPQNTIVSTGKPAVKQPSSRILVPGKDYVMGELTVKFKAGVTDDQINAVLKQYGAKVKSHIVDIKTTVLSVPKGKEMVIQQSLSKSNLVQYAVPDYIGHFPWVPNDPFLSNQWGISNTGQMITGPSGATQGVASADAHLEPAWDVTKGNSIIIADVDSGLDIHNPDFVGKVLIPKDFSGSPYGIDDYSGHGTHVAGIMAANTDNGQGIAGTCPQCTLMVLKDGDDGNYDVAVAQAVTWAADNGAKVINIEEESLSDDPAVDDAINYAWSKGAVIVAAAGNLDYLGTPTYSYPAASPHVVSVANTNNSDLLGDGSNSGSWITIAAPGTNIYSTVPSHAYTIQQQDAQAGYTDNLNYTYMTGTSMAAPVIAGVAGLIWSTPYGTSNQAVVDRLCGTADKISGTGTQFQCGRVDAAAAVSASTSATTTGTALPGYGAAVGNLTAIPAYGSGVVPTTVLPPNFYCLGSCPTTVGQIAGVQAGLVPCPGQVAVPGQVSGGYVLGASTVAHIRSDYLADDYSEGYGYSDSSSGSDSSGSDSSGGSSSNTYVANGTANDGSATNGKNISDSGSANSYDPGANNSGTSGSSSNGNSSSSSNGNSGSSNGNGSGSSSNTNGSKTTNGTTNQQTQLQQTLTAFQQLLTGKTVTGTTNTTGATGANAATLGALGLNGVNLNGVGVTGGTGVNGATGTPQTITIGGATYVLQSSLTPTTAPCGVYTQAGLVVATPVPVNTAQSLSTDGNDSVYATFGALAGLFGL